MRTILRALLGAICLCVPAWLAGCASVPECKPVTRTETVTVYRDRFVTVDPSLVASEPVPPYPAVITNKVLDKHDDAATQALARANDKLTVLRCAGIAGIDGTTASECLTLPKPKTGE